MKILKPVNLNNSNFESVNNDSLKNLSFNSNNERPDFSSNYIPAYSYRSNFVAFLGMPEYPLNSTLANKRPDKSIHPKKISSVEDEQIEKRIKKLVREFQKSNSEETFEKLYSQYEKLICKIARKMSYKSPLEYDDLVQEGKIGLLDAARNADPDSNVKFLSYAYLYIKGGMIKARENGGLVKCSRNLRDSVVKFNRSINDLTSKLEREPTLEELAKETKLSLKDCNELKNFLNGTISIDETINNTENTYGKLLLI
ncbi:MAG: sigma-70 family RNA polymerase sigma factor, partial [Candidatus Gastranaerophilales bacterium]|nr:sigma-70 family RNA polymerase sigma factor [Candidatus Gastranaerophilales bacterium]